MTQDAKVLTVATHKTWIADLFASTNLLPTKHSLGFDAPLYPPTTPNAWWFPTETAARFSHSGVPLNLATIPAEWLDGLWMDALQRQIFTLTIEQALKANVQRHQFCKLAEAKISEIPAQWIEADYFLDTLLQAGLPLGTKVQFASRFLDIEAEYRCFVHNGEVTTVSTYMNNNSTFGQPDFVRDTIGERNARNFADRITGVLHRNQPIAYTLDVARIKYRPWQFAVIEANPAWASNPYDCDPVAVVKAVLASSTTLGDNKTHGKFQWTLDPYLTQYAERKAKLPLEHALV